MKLKTSNHAKAPHSAAFVEQFREVFGADQVHVIWVREGEVSIGQKDNSSKGGEHARQ